MIGDISLDKGGYHHYVTSRIHEFADNWLNNEEKKNQELKKIAEKRGRKSKYGDSEYSYEGFQDDQYEWAMGEMEKQRLEYLGIETWEELVEIIRTIKNYAFESASSIYQQ